MFINVPSSKKIIDITNVEPNVVMQGDGTVVTVKLDRSIKRTDLYFKISERNVNAELISTSADGLSRKYRVYPDVAIGNYWIKALDDDGNQSNPFDFTVIEKPEDKSLYHFIITPKKVEIDQNITFTFFKKQNGEFRPWLKEEKLTLKYGKTVLAIQNDLTEEEPSTKKLITTLRKLGIVKQPGEELKFEFFVTNTKTNIKSEIKKAFLEIVENNQELDEKRSYLTVDKFITYTPR